MRGKRLKRGILKRSTTKQTFPLADFVRVRFTSWFHYGGNEDQSYIVKKDQERTSERTKSVTLTGTTTEWKHSVLIADKLLVRMPDQFQSSSTSNFLRVITGARRLRSHDVDDREKSYVPEKTGEFHPSSSLLFATVIGAFVLPRHIRAPFSSPLSAPD